MPGLWKVWFRWKESDTEMGKKSKITARRGPATNLRPAGFHRNKRKRKRLSQKEINELLNEDFRPD